MTKIMIDNFNLRPWLEAFWSNPYEPCRELHTIDALTWTLCKWHEWANIDIGIGQCGLCEKFFYAGLCNECPFMINGQRCTGIDHLWRAWNHASTPTEKTIAAKIVYDALLELWREERAHGNEPRREP